MHSLGHRIWVVEATDAVDPPSHVEGRLKNIRSQEIFMCSPLAPGLPFFYLGPRHKYSLPPMDPTHNPHPFTHTQNVIKFIISRDLLDLLFIMKICGLLLLLGILLLLAKVLVFCGEAC